MNAVTTITDRRINHEELMRTREIRAIHPLVRLVRLFVVFFLLTSTSAVMAQAPTPTPAPGTGNTAANADALTNLVMVAGNLIPRVQGAVENPLIQGLENLAFWIAVVVMMFSF